MAKKKISKIQQALDGLAANLGDLARKFDALEAKARYDVSYYRDLVSHATDRIGKQNGQVDQMVRQVNAGFEQVKQDLIRAGQGLTAHERDIASLQNRVVTLEQVEVVAIPSKKGKR